MVITFAKHLKKINQDFVRSYSNFPMSQKESINSILMYNNNNNYNSETLVQPRKFKASF